MKNILKLQSIINQYFTIFSLITISAVDAFSQIYSTPYTTTTLAGQIGSGFADGNGANAMFNQALGIAVDKAGNVFVADGGNNVIRKISPIGSVTTIAGQVGVSGTLDAAGTSAKFGEINGIAIDSAGNLYVTDTSYGTVRKISYPSWTVTTLVASNAGLNSPLGIAVDSSGNVYVADTGNYVIRKITPSGSMSIFAGKLGIGTGAAGTFGNPTGIALDSSGNLYVVDNSTSTFSQITPTGVINLIGGFLGSPALLDGSITNATGQFNHPYGLTSDLNGNLYLTDGAQGNYIRKISILSTSPFTGTISTLAGSSIVGSKDGTGSSATFSYAKGIAADSLGNIYISNSGVIIRKGVSESSVPPPTIINNPINSIVSVGNSVSLQVFASGIAGITYQWYLNGSAINGATSNTYYINSANTSNAGSYTVSVSNSAGSVMSTAAILTVNPTVQIPTITVNPTNQTITSGSTAVLQVTATSSTTATYQWLLNNIQIQGATSPTLLIFNATNSNIGTYKCIVSNAGGSVTSTAAQLTFINTANPGRLINLSVLTMVTPNSPLTIGFVNGGAGTIGSESLLIRADGPALTTFGVQNILTDPTLILHGSGSVLAANDNWGSTTTNINAIQAANVATGAFAYSSVSSLDSAIAVSLPSIIGGYTVTIGGNGTGTGNAIAEIYDIPSTTYTAAAVRLMNVSCIQLVQTNSSLTAGFAIGGSTAKTVLIRASGPALGVLGVPGVMMPDPTLTLYSLPAGNSIATNAGWAGNTAVASAANSVSAFAFTNSLSKDSAILITLSPGSYSANVTSATGTSGTALIEVYEVP